MQNITPESDRTIRPASMHRSRNFLATIGALIGAALMMAGCGGDDDFTGENIPQMSIEGEGGFDEGGLYLTPRQQQQTNRERQGEPAGFVVRNTGEVTLELNSISVSQDTPDGISFAGAKGDTGCTFSRNVEGSNDQSGNCTAEQFCDDGDPNQCREATLPETPVSLEPGATQELEFIRLALPQGQTLDCPESAPDQVPDGLREDYCGSVTIDSNSTVDDDYISEGTGRVYFQADPGSGLVEIDGADFTFEGVDPGETVNDTFTLSNVGAQPLTLYNIRIESNNDFPGSFEFTTEGSGANFPIEIPADTNSSRDFTLSYSAPGDATPDDLTFTAFMVVESSSIEALPDQAINIRNAVFTGPTARFTPRALSFSEQNSQTLTISNEGTSNLGLSSIGFEPAEAANAYTIYDDGNPINCTFEDGSLSGCNLGSAVSAGGSKDLTVEYSPGSFDEEVVDLNVTHRDPFHDGYRTNDAQTTGTTAVKLVGTQDGSVARVRPLSLNFVQGGEEIRTRLFVLRNLGTSAYSTDDIIWQPDPANPPVQFFLTEGQSGNQSITEDNPVTVEPSTLKVGRVNYDPTAGEDATTSGVGVVLNGSNNLDYNSASACDSAGVRLCINQTEIVPRPTIDAVISTDAEGDPPEVPVRQTIQLSAANSSASPDSISFYYWMTLDRPDGSHVFISPGDSNVETISIRPDRPGDYTIALGVLAGQATAQETFTFTATPAN